MMIHWDTPRLLIEPNTEIEWMSTSAGAAAVSKDSNELKIYLTGRDFQGRSNIGVIRVDEETFEILDIDEKPIFELGAPGAFDQNGISYPCLLSFQDKEYLYYTGWVEGVQVRWYNGVGLAISENNGKFKKISNAPIFHRTNEDFIGFGSTFVFLHDSKFIAISTRFESWDVTGNNHHYNLKAGTSIDGVNFKWESMPIFPFDDGEIAISKPCVIKVKDTFMMWYSYRGSEYRIGLAASRNGIEWKRFDELHEMKVNEEPWCNKMQCYPYVIELFDKYVMFFNGNGYGRTGLGFTTMKRKSMEALVREVSESID
jgi:predicted GH43/DUF377 family glycosyl hydrolase